MYDSYDEIPAACPHCFASLDSYGTSLDRSKCPRCGRALGEEVVSAWTDVARVTNLAEAGFLTDELIGFGIEARIHQMDEFSALDDRWSAKYLIQVPDDLAQKAATQLQQYANEEPRFVEGDGQLFRHSNNRAVDPLFWRPVALIVLTGIVSFLMGQKLTGQNAARRAAPNSLPSTVNQIDRPFVTEPSPGNPRFRLSFDSRRQTWQLDTDRNNDGRFESRRQFNASGAAR